MEHSTKEIIFLAIIILAVIAGIAIRLSKKREPRKQKGLLKYVNTNLFTQRRNSYYYQEMAEVTFTIDEDQMTIVMDRLLYERHVEKLKKINIEVDYEELWETSLINKKPYFVDYHVPHLNEFLENGED